MKYLELWLVIGFFAVVGVWLHFETRDNRPVLLSETHVETLNSGGAVKSSDPLFADHDSICLYGKFSSEFSDNGCGIFDDMAIALVREGQCQTYSTRGVAAQVMIEYDWECRSLNEKFELRIVRAQKGIPGDLVFRPIRER